MNIIPKPKILVITSCPPNEVIGCGGILSKHYENRDIVHVCYVTRPFQPRLMEMNFVTRLLRFRNIYHLNYHTTKLDDVNHNELCDRIREIIVAYKPDIMYIPHEGNHHPDDKIIHNSTVTTLGTIDNGVEKILSYEVQPNVGFKPDSYMDISGCFERKLKSMKLYECESQSIDDVESLARKRGSKINVKYGEAFEVIR